MSPGCVDFGRLVRRNSTHPGSAGPAATMPEGHTIHRWARLQRQALAGQVVRATSPQGRFADGAARLDGQRLDDVEAHGKHLFSRFSKGDLLHVHLGLIGRFALFGPGTAPAPTPGTRLALTGEDGTTLHLAGAMAVELIDPGREEEIRGRLGPDPLLVGLNGRKAFVQNLRRRSIPVGAALLDQAVVAGIGNAYRAEVLFLCGVHPDRPAKSLTDDEVGCLWRTIVAQLRKGERSGRIRTTPRGAPDDRFVYRRAGLPCLRCGTPVAAWPLAGRTISACPACQPPRAAGSAREPR